MTKEKKQDMISDISNITSAVISEIEKQVTNSLNKCGLFYKCFARVKKGQSVCEKVEDREKRGVANYKIQDLVGVRIAVYFKEDIELCESIILNHFKVVDISKDEERTEVFRPQRVNYVCEIPKDIIDLFDNHIWDYPIDKTFEIQIRTIFSEGWHEVEHDFRYKCLDEWKDKEDIGRTLNGVLATLENCDWAISSLLDSKAYRHYKTKEWIPMLRNVLRIKVQDCGEMDEIGQYFDDNGEVAKRFFRFDRKEFLVFLANMRVSVPLKMTTLVYLINYSQIKDEFLLDKMPESLKRMIKK